MSYADHSLVAAFPQLIQSFFEQSNCEFMRRELGRQVHVESPLSGIDAVCSFLWILVLVYRVEARAEDSKANCSGTSSRVISIIANSIGISRSFYPTCLEQEGGRRRLILESSVSAMSSRKSPERLIQLRTLNDIHRL